MSHTRQKHVKNKIHKARPKKRFFKKAGFWYFLLFFVLLIIILYFLLFFKGFWIKNIEVYGNQKNDSEKIKNVIDKVITKKILRFNFINISSKSIFLLKTDEIEKEILKFDPSVKNVFVEKQWPSGLKIQIEERKNFATWCQQDKCFYIDDAGIIFEEASLNFKDNFIVRQNQLIENIFVGENIIQSNTMQAIYKIEKNLKENFQINLMEALISTPIRLDIKTGEGWKIYFNIDPVEFNIDIQLAKLDLLLKNEITTKDRENLEYIDLRFEGRAYYK